MSTNPHRVLVIDDEPALRSLLRDMLEACGYRCDAVADGPAGVAQFRAHRYEAVITDMLMPGMNGLQVATALRALDPHVHIIMLTGSAPALTMDGARGAGVNTLLHKPIPLRQLKSAVDAACATAR
jgi:CheY-like chemotaxis protein